MLHRNILEGAVLTAIENADTLLSEKLSEIKKTGIRALRGELINELDLLRKGYGLKDDNELLKEQKLPFTD